MTGRPCRCGRLNVAICFRRPCPHVQAVLDSDAHARAQMSDPGWQAWKRERDRLENDRRAVRRDLRCRLLNVLHAILRDLWGPFDPERIARRLREAADVAETGSRHWYKLTDRRADLGPAPDLVDV